MMEPTKKLDRRRIPSHIRYPLRADREAVGRYRSGGKSGTFMLGFRDMVRAFGQPNCDASGDGKVSTCWIVRDVATGQTYQIYDYKETNLYSKLKPSVAAFRRAPYAVWHVSTARTFELDFLEKLSTLVGFPVLGKAD